jgi:hypothetical protein
MADLEVVVEPDGDPGRAEEEVPEPEYTGERGAPRATDATRRKRQPRPPGMDFDADALLRRENLPRLQAAMRLSFPANVTELMDLFEVELEAAAECIESPQEAFLASIIRLRSGIPSIQSTLL